MAQDQQNEWLSTDDAKRHIGVSAATLYRLVDEGLLPAYRPSRSLRFRRRDLDAYLEEADVVLRRAEAEVPGMDIPPMPLEADFERMRWFPLAHEVQQRFRQEAVPAG